MYYIETQKHYLCIIYDLWKTTVKMIKDFFILACYCDIIEVGHRPSSKINSQITPNLLGAALLSTIAPYKR